MKRELIASALVLVAGIAIAGAILAVPALAQERSAPNIQFPVAELGNCGSERECKTYCNDPAHVDACITFAEKNGLMSREETATARKFSQGGFKGPGGCTSKESCESYCDNVAHINECIAFAEANGIIPPEELAEAKQVQAAIQRGVKPPACGNKRSCDTYCRAPAHMKECIAFGEAAGFIQGKELEDAKKMIAAIERGVTPPPCGGKEECDVYCAEEANFPQCIAFAEAAGFMSAKDVEMAKKTGGKGPGNCRGKEECEAFCQSPSNQETCFAFAKEHGLIPAEDLQRMEEGKAQMKQGLSQAPSQVLDCLKSSIGEEMLGKLQAGTGMPSQDLGEKMRVCFEKMPRPSGAFDKGGGPQGMPPQGAQGGEGQQFGPPQGAFQGPGGCTSPEGCQSYCTSNPDACQSFGPGSVPGPGGEGAQFQGQIPEGARQMMEQGMMPAYPGPQGSEGAAPPPGYEGGPGPGQQYPMMPQGGIAPQQPPQGFQSAPPPPPPAESPPPPASMGPQSLLSLFLNIFRGQ
ncbi:MAG: hypothetical protein V1656_01840 [Candidatus Jorgensenbacteria bacterium]